MYRISARISGGLAACLAAAALVGCASAPAAGKPGQTPGAPATSAGTPAACLRTSTITLAGNGKTYCFRVGEKLDVFLRGTLASMWQEPQVSGDVLRGVPNGAFSLVAGLTGASYAAVRPGRALLTSVRLPCPSGGSCAPDHGFRAVIIVLRLCVGPAGVGLRAGPGPVFGVGDQIAHWVSGPWPGECLLFRVLIGPPGAARAERTVIGMDNRNEIRDFLVSRRARISPEQAGLPAYGGHRRVAGLRREEVALLAGVSVDYYTRLERGNAHGASEGVLEAIARALQLDEAERAHLFDLARAAGTTARAPRRPGRQQVRPSVQRILDSMITTPAYVRNGRLDILAANRLGRALYSPVFDSPAQPANPARFIFLDPSAPQFYLEWERQAQDIVAMLRSEAGRNPHDRALSGLIGELSTRSQIFRTWWAAHNVRFHRSGVKRLHHPVVGDLTLTFEALDVAADEGLRISAYTAEPGTPSHDALNLLASWAATVDQAETARATEGA